MPQLNIKNMRLLSQYFEESDRVVLLTHYNPDGDAIGSMLSLFYFLRQRGTRADMITPNKIPGFLTWMPAADQIRNPRQDPEWCREKILRAELIISLDFNALSRVDDLQDALRQSRAAKVLIDHHPDPESFSELVFSSTEMSSTAEYLYRILSALDPEVKKHKEIAACTLAGIMSDTGCFSYNSSSGDTFRLVGELLDTGIDKDEIYDNIYTNYSADRMQLMGRALKDRLVVMAKYHTAYIYLSTGDQEKYKYRPGDTEGFVNLPLSIRDIRFTALFVEKKGHIKISFRSKGDFPVHLFGRKHFQGGGHANAAGGESKLPLKKTLLLFEQLVKDYEKELS